jgi:Fibronectin type III domain
MEKKAKVVLNLSVLSIPDKVNLTEQFKTALTGNPNFKTVGELLGLTNEQAQKLQQRYNKVQAIRNEGITETALMHQEADVLESLLKQLGLTVEAESKGDPALIKSAGMQVRRTASKAGIPSLPEALAAKEGSKPGSIFLKWKGVRGSRTYLVRATTDVGNEASWQQVAVTTKAKVEIEGLTSGKQYWFQVCAVGTAGLSPWSDPATKVVP